MSGDWQSAASLPPLKPDEVQVWRVHLGHGVPDAERCRRYLSSLELERLDRFRAEQAGTQFLVARACLRILLGNLLNLSPDLVPITLSAYGKPELAPGGNRLIFFNLAHSGETILIALCRASRVGVDVEHFDRTTDFLEIARSSFAKKELLQIESVADLTLQKRAFLRIWTQKEAILKADGRGLSVPLASVEGPLLESAAAKPALIIEASPDGTAPSIWFVTDLALGEEVSGACAVALPGLTLRTINFPLELLLNA